MMTANREVLYWRQDKNWYTFDSKTSTFSIRDDAPQRAKDSFALWKDKGFDKNESERGH